MSLLFLHVPILAIVSGSFPSGDICITDAAYGAVGNCSTADDAAIQTAINAAFTAGGSQPNPPTVYRPAIPNSCYKRTQPLYINQQQHTMSGAGQTATKFFKTYDGPTIIIQGTAGTSPCFGRHY